MRHDDRHHDCNSADPATGSHHAQVCYPDRRELYRRQAGTGAPGAQRHARGAAKAVPGAEEVISYGIPALRDDGRIVVFFAAWKEHCALYPVTGKLIAAFKDELAPYELSHKGTVRFPLDHPVPTRLIGRIAKYRAGELAQEKVTKRKKAAKKPARVKAKR